MLNSIFPNNRLKEINVNDKVLAGLTLAFLFIICLTVLQDLMESIRSGYSFNFDESLLFKTFWVPFIPIITILNKRLKKEDLSKHPKTLLFIVLPIAFHFLIATLMAYIFSLLFFEGRYDLYKFYSYSLANDFYKLIIIYSGFVLFYKYLQNPSKVFNAVQKKNVLNEILINNGKNNTIVWTKDIFQITAATPYIFIHLENQRYLHSETLKSIGGQLDSNIFIRIHKSTIVNLTKIKSFKSRMNGDYDVQLANGDVIRLSRTYVCGFKNKFVSSPQDTLQTHRVKR